MEKTTINCRSFMSTLVPTEEIYKKEIRTVGYLQLLAWMNKVYIKKRMRTLLPFIHQWLYPLNLVVSFIEIRGQTLSCVAFLQQMQELSHTITVRTNLIGKGTYRLGSQPPLISVRDRTRLKIKAHIRIVRKHKLKSQQHNWTMQNEYGFLPLPECMSFSV